MADAMKYNKPVVTNRGRYKFVVKVHDKNGNDKLVYFGHRDYEDFTQHRDIERRRRYLARASCIHTKDGRLTKDDITSANYWSMRYLWNYHPQRSVKRSPRR
jgi:hypothetical protein